MKEIIIDDIKYIYENNTIFDIQATDWENQEDVTITIPEKIDDKIITNIDIHRYQSKLSSYNSVSICRRCFRFKKLIIPDSISAIYEGSFYFLHCKEVVWSSNCYVIPENCFRCSDIEKIENIDHVYTIKNAAFAHCESLKEFSWPSKCEIIPEYCFWGCYKLLSVSNFEAVYVISKAAFLNCENIKTIKPKNISDINFIEDDAFLRTNLTLDLSETSLSDIDYDFLDRIGVKGNNVILPCFYN